MLDPIAIFTALNDRWPGFFDAVRSSNGWTVEDMSYERFMTFNTMMIADDEGQAMLQTASALIKDNQDPAVRAWMEEHGFVSRETLECGRRLDAARTAFEEGRLSADEFREIIEATKALAERRKNHRQQRKEQSSADSEESH